MLLLFKGYAAGPYHNRPGSGSNHLCLHEDPQWKTYLDGDQTNGLVVGVEYELFSYNNVFSKINNGGNSFEQNPAPCAVCYVTGRSSILMVPARTQCPDGWTTEYSGYLVSTYTGTGSTLGHQRSSYSCWDEAPEVAVGGVSQDQAVIYPVEVECGSLPCSVYITGRELTCIVCSKWWIFGWRRDATLTLSVVYSISGSDGQLCGVTVLIQKTNIWQFFTCVSYAEARKRYRLDVRPSVRLSVCHTLARYQNGWTYCHDFFTTR